MLPSKAICSGSVATGLSEPGATLQPMQLNAALGDLARSQKVAEPAADSLLSLTVIVCNQRPLWLHILKAFWLGAKTLTLHPSQLQDSSI